MDMIRKLFILLVMIITASAEMWGADNLYAGGFAFTKDKDNDGNNIATIVAMDPKYYGDVTIPTTLIKDGITYTVTDINKTAFQNCTQLTSVVIPSTVDHISDNAFSGCTKLETVVVKGEITKKLGNGLFSGCTNLKLAVFEKGVVGASDNVFSSCPSVEIYAPSGSTLLNKKLGGSSTTVKEFNRDQVTDGATGSDGIPTYNVDKEHQFMTFKRSFSSTEKWQALYIPFSLSYNEWKDEFEIAKLISIHRYYDDDGVETGWLLEVVPLESGSTTPLTPYVIRGKHTGECSIDVNNKTVYRAEKKSLTCESIETLYTFEGTIAQEDKLNQPGWYVISDGSLKKVGSATSKLKAYRWILKCTAKDGQLYDDGISSTSEIRIRVKGDVFGESGNEEITAIEYTEDNTHTVVPTAYYSVNGTVSKSAKKGFNIVRMSDGSVRKVVVR